MNQATSNNAGGTEPKRPGAAGRIRRMAPGLAFFAAGMALTAAWFLRAPSHEVAPVAAPPALSEATRAVLQRLGSPVEIRFYSLLDPASVGDNGREFSGRVDQLLSQYEQEAGGNIRVVRVTSVSSSAADAAVADGIRPFNMDKGDACFLGIAVVRAKQKETLSVLEPEWEQALEPDLTRAIARAGRDDSPAAFVPRVEKATMDTVKRLIPNLDSVSLAEGRETLRKSSLAEFRRNTEELETRRKEAEEHFLEAQAGQSEAGQETARKELLQIQADQLTSWRRLTAASQAQMTALEQIKGAVH